MDEGPMPVPGQPDFKELVNCLDGIFWEADARTFAFTYVSHQAERILGYPVAQWSEPGFWADHLHPEDRERALAYCVACTGRLEPHSFDYRFLKADGTVVWLLDKVIVLAGEDGQPRWLQGLMVDITAQKERELAARRWEVFFHQAESAMALGDCRTNTILEVNAAFARQRGFTPAELHGRPWLDTFPADARASLPAHVAEITALGHGHFESRHLRKDGTTFPVDVEVTVLKDAQGTPLHRLVVIHDLTELKGQAQSLTEESRRLRAVVDGTGAGTWEWNVRTGETRFNERWAEILGHTLEELAPISIDTWLRLAHPDDLQASVALLERHFAGELPLYQCEVRMRHKDGRWVWVLDRGKVFEWAPDGSPLWMGGTHQDITERKAAETDLRASEARYRMLIEESPMPMVLHQEGRIVFANPAALRLLKAPRAEDLIGTLVLDRVHPDDRAVSVERIRQVEQPGQSAPGITQRILALDGTVILAEVAGHSLLVDGVLTILVFVIDLTERKRMEAELARTQRLDSLGALAGGVAHDINNVLGAILGFADLHLLKAPAGERLHQDFSSIRQACLRGRDMVRGLLDFSRRELGRNEPVDLNDLVREEAALLERTTLQKVALVSELEPHLRPISGDPAALSQVLMNLCVNAVHAMPDGGTLTLATRNEGAGRVVLEVADTGCGMTPEVAARALEPFFTTKPDGQGTGLGLSMTYGVVKAHGATLSLESEPGRGTRVRIDFPALAAPAGVPQDDGGGALPEGPPSLTVLVVDDDDLMRESLGGLLELLGHRVEQAAGGEEAVARVAAGLACDLAVLDQNMPGLSGLGTLEALRRHRPDLPVLLASGHVSAEVAQRLGELPQVALLPKPFTLQELQQGLNLADLR